MKDMNEKNRQKMKSYALRQDILDIVYAGKTGHIGGDFSVIDILLALYNHMDITPENFESQDRDHFVLSKGHCVEALYAVLADKGFIRLKDVVATYSKFGSDYIGHPSNKIFGVEMNSGSLGHGLSVCVGMALAGKRLGKTYRVYTVMGDGELAEGSIWEAAMAASNFELDNLCAIVDRNHLQISGDTEEVMQQGDVAKRFESFGWNTIELEDGNDPEAIERALQQAQACSGKPTLIVANTIKGYGAKIMEAKAGWHHKVPNDEEYAQITAELTARKEAICHE